VAAAEIARLDGERSALQVELSMFSGTAQHCQALRQKKAEYTSDVSKFDQLLQDVAAHQQAVHSKVAERRKEAAERKSQEEQLKEEHSAIQQTLAAQEFTPLQIQSMSQQQHSHLHTERLHQTRTSHLTLSYSPTPLSLVSPAVSAPAADDAGGACGVGAAEEPTAGPHLHTSLPALRCTPPPLTD
jgi:DNA repair exonuclease SbcCD ATPase subunit